LLTTAYRKRPGQFKCACGWFSDRGEEINHVDSRIRCGWTRALVHHQQPRFREDSPTKTTPRVELDVFFQRILRTVPCSLELLSEVSKLRLAIARLALLLLKPPPGLGSGPGDRPGTVARDADLHIGFLWDLAWVEP
jgi:hypothetical protein